MNNPTLPPELIREILLRLPVRSVLHCKCVCKSWLSLISDPQFSISHYDLAANPSHRVLLRANYLYAESIDVDAPFHSDSSAVYLLLPPLSPPHNPCHYDAFQFDPDIWGSCRGFILLYYRRCRCAEIILWNPSIGVHKRLPNVKHYYITNGYLRGLGYDPSTNDYLVVCIRLLRDETTILICSTKTYSWNIVYGDVLYRVRDNKFRAGSLVNGALHWLVFSRYKKVPVIIAFDLIQRRLSEIPLIDHLTSKKYEFYCLRAMGEFLSVSCSVEGCAENEIWVMKEYKVQSSWTKYMVIPTYEMQYNRFSPICFTKDGRILGSNIGGRLEKLNDKGKVLEILTYGGYEKLYCVNLQSAMYRESLLSIPNVIRETCEDDQP